MPRQTNRNEKAQFSREIYRRDQQHIEELEKLADQIWPGKDMETRNVRAYNVWAQINEKTDWEEVALHPFDHDPAETMPEDVADICMADLEPCIGVTSTGFGDHLREELRRQGSNLETLFMLNTPDLETVPWEELTPSIYTKTTYERYQIRKKATTSYVWNHF